MCHCLAERVPPTRLQCLLSGHRVGPPGRPGSASQGDSYCRRGCSCSGASCRLARECSRAGICARVHVAADSWSRAPCRFDPCCCGCPVVGCRPPLPAVVSVAGGSRVGCSWHAAYLRSLGVCGGRTTWFPPHGQGSGGAVVTFVCAQEHAFSKQIPVHGSRTSTLAAEARERFDNRP